MKFILHRSSIKEVKQFLALSEGHYIWTKGTEGNVSALVAAGSSGRTIKLKGVTGSINVGDYAEINGNYYIIMQTGSTSIVVKPGLQNEIYPNMAVTIIKQQMVIIINQQFDIGSEGRAAGDINDINVEDETYSLTLSLLMIRT
jgi:hypothetical protein